MFRALRVIALAVALAAPSVAPGADVLSVQDTTVDADEFDLVLPIELTSDQSLTHLRFDLAFDPAFCDRLDDPAGIALCGAGRETVDPDDTIPITCSDGSIRIDVQDNGAVVIPAGSGEIVEVDFGTLDGTAAGSVVFTPMNVLARAGGTNVPVTVVPGTVTIRAVTTMTTTTTSPGPTVSSTTTSPTGSTSTMAGPSATSTSTTSPGTTATTTPGQGATTTTTTTTPTAPGPAGCAVDMNAKPTFAGVRCLLDALVAATDAATGAGEVPAALGHLLRRAPATVDAAEAHCADANTRRARAGLRSAMRIVAGYRHRLMRAHVPADVRSPLEDAAGTVLFEARFLRGFLACPVS